MLDDEILRLRKEIKSDRLSMSIGELAGLYQRGELDIHPKFQRVLRWQQQQKTRLIESLLLRIPVPPIYVAQDADGLWDVVDGMQRLGTIFEFLGILKDRDGVLRKPLRLESTKLLPDLEGVAFAKDEQAQDDGEAFSKALQLDFQRSRLDLEILLKESDPTTKYELFERLNTGGSIASDQEVRNCIMVWANEKRFDWMSSLATHRSFREAVQLPERREDEQFRMELVLRFLVLYSLDGPALKEVGDFGEFLNEKNRAIAKDTGYVEKTHGTVFKKTFDILEECLSEDAFRKYDKSKKAFRGGFLISAFEAAACGVAHNLSLWSATDDRKTKLSGLIRSMWTKAPFTEHIGIGIATKDRLRHTVPFGRRHFKP
jgi:hypothetical protein